MAIPKDYFEWAAKLFDPVRIHEKPEALDDLLVLDLFQGDYGARDFVDAKRYSGVAYRSSRAFHAQ